MPCSTSLSLSIVIPVFNEEKRLAVTFDALDCFVRKNIFKKLEVIFVNDGSRDKTYELIENFRPGCRVRCISYSINHGKGYAIREGMKQTTNDYCLMMDADISTPLTEIEKFIPLMKAGKPIIIGIRKGEGAKVEKHQPWYRRKMGRVYTLLASAFTGVWVSDFTCGFKCFSQEATQIIFPQTVINHWSYDAEILALAKVHGIEIYEVGVRWINDERTRVRIAKDTLQSFRDLLKIRNGIKKGLYGKTSVL